MVADFRQALFGKQKLINVQAHEPVNLPSYLERLAKSQNEAGAEMVASEEGGIFSWSKAVLHLFRQYAQSSLISSTIADLQAVSQRPKISG